MTAVMLAVTVMCGIVLGNYQEAQAADLSAGALQYGLDLSFLESLFMAGGLSLGLDMLLKTQNDIDKFKEENWDFGDLLDQPLTQKEIDEAQEKIEKLYYGATEAYKKTHGNGSKPTPTPMITEPPAPGVTPPVTVAPINPDDVTMPDDWATMKKNATDKGVLAMGAATAYCVKEAVKGWWDDIMDTENEVSIGNNPYSYSDCIGYVYKEYTSGKDALIDKHYMYSSNFNPLIDIVTTSVSYDKTFVLQAYDSTGKNSYSFDCFTIRYKNGTLSQAFKGRYYTLSFMSNSGDYNDFHTINYSIYVPYTLNGENHDAELKPLGKSSMWPSTDTKDDYNNNNSLPSPSYPNLAVPSITLPTLDEIKDLWKQGSDDEENRPTYVTNFITNHTVQPTPEPEPTKKPEVNPNPGGGTDPDPKPSASPTPAVNPDPGGGTDPQPSGTPDPNPDPDNPDNPDPTPEEEASPYKADLREIFPFCIPFDLIHLFKVFDAEPEAPVFKFPLDLELDNPWTGEKVVDYHHEFEFDFSDYEDLIKLLRIIQIVAFITGLMMITRQQMIKG